MSMQTLSAMLREQPRAKLAIPASQPKPKLEKHTMAEVIRLNKQIAVIQVLHRQLLDNATDIGRRLAFCKDIVEQNDGSFEDWAKTYLHWSPRKTASFMRRFDHMMKIKSNGGISPDATLLRPISPSWPDNITPPGREGAVMGEILQ